MLAERKTASKRIGELVSEGKSVEEAKAEVDAVLARLAEELVAATLEAEAVQAELDTLLLETLISLTTVFRKVNLKTITLRC